MVLLYTDLLKFKGGDWGLAMRLHNRHVDIIST